MRVWPLSVNQDFPPFRMRSEYSPICLSGIGSKPKSPNRSADASRLRSLPFRNPGSSVQKDVGDAVEGLGYAGDFLAKTDDGIAPHVIEEWSIKQAGC